MTTHYPQENIQTNHFCLSFPSHSQPSLETMFISPNVPRAFPHSLEIGHQRDFFFLPQVWVSSPLWNWNHLSVTLTILKLTGQKSSEALPPEWAVVFRRHLIPWGWLGGFSHVLLSWSQHFNLCVNSFWIVAGFHVNWKLSLLLPNMIETTCCPQQVI